MVGNISDMHAEMPTSAHTDAQPVPYITPNVQPMAATAATRSSLTGLT